MDEENLGRYAKLLVEHALALRENQRLDIWGETCHTQLAHATGDAAYAAGAGPVYYHLFDPFTTAQLIRCARRDQIALHYLETQAWLGDMIRSRAALLVLVGKNDPSALADLQRAHPANHHAFALESSLFNRDLQRRALDQGLLPFAAATCPTAGWAQRVFPELPEPEALRSFWRLIFHFTGVDQPDPRAHADRAADLLATRAAALDALEIREIHVTGGGNDFRVSLASAARWRGGAHTTADGQRFFPNLPSFEIFTTPDRGRTEGRLVASRPVQLNGGVVVENLGLELRAGKVVSFEASSGEELFARWLEVDEGARYLGELGLVGQDSPVAHSRKVFHHLLLDENAAAHVALGQGFATCFDFGGESSPSQLDAAGCNRSAIHTDIPFGSPEITVVATQTRQGEVVLLERGAWVGSGGHLREVGNPQPRRGGSV